MISVSGVPPDYFNESGQRWGTPVYRWEKLKEQGYEWWVKRINKNLQWYDLLRLDHFRAFAAYWSVPTEEGTAINGKWIDGPGEDFFQTLLTTMPGLPLVAEDLGEIDEKVYKLKDRFALPGMKVLQFAFGDDMAQSAHIPHHHTREYFVYTGTHDNNTTLGWLRQDAGEAAIRNLKSYLGSDINEKKVVHQMIKIALASVCRWAIIPIQDWFNMDEGSRMNKPADGGDNWRWQLPGDLFRNIPVKKIKKWTRFYDRV